MTMTVIKTQVIYIAQNGDNNDNCDYDGDYDDDSDVAGSDNCGVVTTVFVLF